MPAQGWTKNPGNNDAKLKKCDIIKQTELLGNRTFLVIFVYKELQKFSIRSYKHSSNVVISNLHGNSYRPSISAGN